MNIADKKELGLAINVVMRHELALSGKIKKAVEATIEAFIIETDLVPDICEVNMRKSPSSGSASRIWSASVKIAL